jgi:hypothetical protein
VAHAMVVWYPLQKRVMMMMIMMMQKSVLLKDKAAPFENCYVKKKEITAEFFPMNVINVNCNHFK